MPTVLREQGFRFHFYASDGDEPIHVHVAKGAGFAKIWLEPRAESQYFVGFKASERAAILRLADVHRERLVASWREFFGE